MTTFELSTNAQAILLLTAPLIAGQGQGEPAVKPLGPREYRDLAFRLRERERQPSDLLSLGTREVVEDCGAELDAERLQRLLDRGFLLAQAVERWRTRAIWVRSRADADYPRRLKKRLGEDAPPVLYGCGDPAILNIGGLAVVGSRDVPDTLVKYAEDVGRLVAESDRGLTSGDARGVDKAGMRGALGAGGRVAGILANGLEKAAMRREHRSALMEGQLVLASPYDPASRFNVGHAMRRNKLIYALSDAALVVEAECERGGTWAGAVEQLGKLKLVPIYVRSTGAATRGLEELCARGARAWPNPDTGALKQLLDGTHNNEQPGLERLHPSTGTGEAGPASAPCPADLLFAKVAELIEGMYGPRTEADVAVALQVSKRQADTWLKRYVEGRAKQLFEADDYRTEAEVAELLQVPRKYARSCLTSLVAGGALEKHPRPLRYRRRGRLVPLDGDHGESDPKNDSPSSM